MSGDRCVRCGRERSAGDRLQTVEAPWASFEDGDVCPDCQTPAERDEAARRVVAAVEREVERRRAEGIAPAPSEPALIAYAMGSRHAAETGRPVPDADTEPSTPPEDIDGPLVQVAVTGAFLTGHPLAVRVDGYGTLQRALGRALKRPQWRIEPPTGGDGTYESGGGFTDPLPLVIARRDGTDLLPFLAGALDRRRHVDAGGEVLPRELRSATPISLDIDIYDLGVAVMIAWLEVVPAASADLAATARAVKRLVRLRADGKGRSPLVTTLQDIACCAAEQYGDAVAATASKELHVAWLARAAPEPLDDSRVDAPADERGRLLWLHPVHVLQAPQDHDRTAKDLAPAFHERMQVDGGCFAPGIGSSAIVASPQSRAEATPIRMTALHWAYYALYMAIDRGLLLVLDQQRWSRPAPLQELEADADDVFADYLRVMDARARLDSHLSALGGDEFAIWELIARVQRFAAVEKAVDGKLEVLQKLAHRRVEQANAYRTRRLGDILGALTVLTVVTVAVALLGTFLGSRSNAIDSVWLRAAIVAVAGAASVLLYWAAFVRSTRARPTGTRSSIRDDGAHVRDLRA